jgi:hypothetical protein
MILNIGDPLYRPFPKGAAHFNSATPREAMLALLPPALVAGETGSGLVVLTNPPEGETVVSLQSDRPDAASVPESIKLSAKANAVKFPIVTHQTIDETAGVRISVTAGDIHRSNTLTLLACKQTLTLSPARVSGGTAVTGTVTLSPPNTEGARTLKLSSDHPALVTVPAEIEVPAGMNWAPFRMTTHAAASETSVGITASFGGCNRTATLALIP